MTGAQDTQKATNRHVVALLLHCYREQEQASKTDQSCAGLAPSSLTVCLLILELQSPTELIWA